jgi:hypothetical protein
VSHDIKVANHIYTNLFNSSSLVVLRRTTHVDSNVRKPLKFEAESKCINEFIIQYIDRLQILGEFDK